MAMPKPDLPLVLAELRPGVDCGPGCVSGASYADLVKGWRADIAVPTQAEVDSKWAELWAARRRPRAAADLLAAIQALTAADRGKLLAAMCADWLRQHPRAAEQIGIPLPGDEPEP